MKKIILLGLILSACQKTDEKITPQQTQISYQKSAIEADTTSDEGQLQVVEIEDHAQFAGSDNWVKFTNCYATFDSTFISSSIFENYK